MAVTDLAVLAGAIAVVGIAGCRADRPVTPADKAQAVRAQKIERDRRPDRCAEANRFEQMDARGDHFVGAEAFDSFGCQGPRP